MFGKVAALAAAGVMLAGQAAAADAAIAQVSAVKGNAVVSQNGRIAALNGATSLKAGDRVVAKDGQVSLAYADGCKITLKANSMATIGAASPCASQQGLVNAGSDSSQLFGLTWFGTALVVVGVAGALYVAFDDDDDSVSP
jgi:DUF971 family protein